MSERMAPPPTSANRKDPAWRALVGFDNIVTWPDRPAKTTPSDRAISRQIDRVLGFN